VSAVTQETAVARPGVGALLRELDQAPPSELVEVCSGWLARHVSAQACVLLLADYAEASLEPVVGGPAVAHIRPQALSDSAAGEAYREQRRVTAARRATTDGPRRRGTRAVAYTAGAARMIMPSLLALSRTQLYPAARIALAGFGIVLAAAWLAERTTLIPADPLERVSTMLVAHPFIVAATLACLAAGTWAVPGLRNPSPGT
jgi:hypothetical protein